MNRYLRTLVTVFILGCSCILASADPLDYDELVNGDISPPGSPLATLQLGAGTNTIRGQMHYLISPAGVESDWDPVQLALPAGMVLSGFHLDLVTTNVTNTYQLEMDWVAIASGSSPVIAHACYAIASTPIYCAVPLPMNGPIFESLPGGASIYSISQGISTQSYDATVSAGASFDYVLSVTVSAVPESSTAALWLCGLVVVLLLTSRRLARSIET